MESIYEMIELSNYLLNNYWWIILPVSILFSIIMTRFYLRLEESIDNDKIIDENEI